MRLLDVLSTHVSVSYVSDLHQDVLMMSNPVDYLRFHLPMYTRVVILHVLLVCFILFCRTI